MNTTLIFSLIIGLGFLPLAIFSVRFLYKNSLLFTLVLIIFVSAIFCSLMAFIIGEYGFQTLYWIIPTCIVGLLVLDFSLKRFLKKPLLQLKDNVDEIAKGILDVKDDEILSKKNNELGQISTSIKKLATALDSTSDFANQITNLNFNVKHEILSEKDELGIALLNMRDSLKKSHIEERKRKEKEENELWINQGIAKFGDILRKNSDDSTKLAFKYISELVDYLGIVQGALFLLNEDVEDDVYFELSAAVAYNRKKSFKKKIKIGENLVGRCAFEKEPITLTEIPENYIKITSGLGSTNPRCIFLCPAVLEGKVYGVIELISFNILEDFEQGFIQRVAENLAATISNVKANEQTKRLLDESRKQSEELAAQEEEMRQNLEELQATQEEMERKEEKYIEMEKKLKEYEKKFSITNESE